MATLNETLIKQQFYDDNIIKPHERRGFKGVPRVVTLRGPFKLYKLAPKGNAGQYIDRDTNLPKVTPWWSPVDPYEEDHEGATGRFIQAVMNGIDMSSMVRYMSAVLYEWSEMTHYIEISIKPGDQVKCFWGEYEPQFIGQRPFTLAKHELIANCNSTTTQSKARGFSDAEMPNVLGALSAWQFFIPNFTDEYIKLGSWGRREINAKDMGALGRYLGCAFILQINKFKKFFSETQDIMRGGIAAPRHQALKDMDGCLNDIRSTMNKDEIINFLNEFCRCADRFLSVNDTLYPRNPTVDNNVRKYRTIAAHMSMYLYLPDFLL